ncbi:MAG: DUF3105 domain-containing protein [Terracoccus sp.]
MAGKKSERGSIHSNADRRQVVADMQARERSRARRRTVALWGSITAVVVAIALAVTVVVVREQGDQPDLSAVSSFTVKQGHVDTPVTYAQIPPAGGEHSPVWLNCGAYTAPVSNENAVHALEHGAVWVTYRPDLPPEQVTALRESLPSTYAVLSPFTGLKAPVVVSAWGKQLVLTGADDPRLGAFVKAYRQGPQTPEPGAACSGGTGNPAPTGG